MIIMKSGKYTMKKEDNKYIIYRKNNKVQTITSDSDEKAIEIFNKWYN